MKRIAIVTLILICIGIALIGSSDSEKDRFHTDMELSYYQKSMNYDSTFVDGWNALFAASGECKGCHGTDPQGFASVDAQGNDINVSDDWRATMMAMSAKDPFWRAKVSHEALVSPELQAEIESSCTDCHAPLGFYNAVHLGLPHYTMEDLKMDSVALDGVSCGACHQISADSVGLTFSGIDIKYVEDTIYGPYEDPFAGPMQSFVGFMPVYSEHTAKSELCASCHTLITETIGLDGQLTGEEFVEQATYHEWVNSAYNTEDESAMECQSCHMTRVDDDIIISANLLFLPPRSPFFRHNIVGGNTFMLDMMKEHRDTLDIRAYASHFDSVRASTMRMLQENTLDIALSELDRTEDSLFVDVELINKAGHKFPSAYPSRIAYVQFIAMKDNGDTLFKSGILDEEYELIERDEEYEQHYDLINSEEQVQVYELVIADETGAETTVLSQAEYALKDNRLAPFGFTDSHFTYDTVSYHGMVLDDDDFNLNDIGEQGSGTDDISYHIFTDGYMGEVEVKVKVFFQITPPRWLESMFEYSSEDIDIFNWMYESADKDPVEIVADSLLSTISSLAEIGEIDDIVVFPNPTYTGEIAISNRSNKSIDRYEVMNALGELVMSNNVRGNTVYLNIPEEAGIYFIRILSRNSEQIVQVLRY
ncbi:MAG: T9SS type A sorting domain-containing protein [Flavobacteriales bacterium]|nr:T9SS type A sorting domain-containing protein [Flavobacteriales bacterium]